MHAKANPRTLYPVVAGPHFTATALSSFRTAVDHCAYPGGLISVICSVATVYLQLHLLGDPEKKGPQIRMSSPIL
jgi:hypothetical protein